MHFDIQHNTLQIKHKKNYFFFLFYNNQNTYKMTQKSVFFSSSRSTQMSVFSVTFEIFHKLQVMQKYE